MSKIDLEVKQREKTGKKSKGLRSSGIIPAVVYGKGIDPQAIEIEKKSFEKLIAGVHGENVIINLKVIGKRAIPVITHDIQRDAISDMILSIDFMKVNLEEKIKAKVKIELIGIPVGVKEDAGILIHGLHEIEVKCLPESIPDKIDIDVTPLRIGHSVLVSDLKKAPGVEFATPLNEMLASVVPPAKVEEVAPPPTAEAVPSEKGAAPEAAAATGAAAPKVEEKTAPGKAAPGKEEAKKPEKK